MVQWLGVCSFTAEGPGSIPGQGTKIRQAVQWAQGKKITLFGLNPEKYNS